MNHLREPSTFNFIQALNKHVKEIDLSHNEVGLNSIEHFTKTLKTKSETLDLRIIKLHKAQITDQSVSKLLKGFEECDKPHMLQELSLAGNFITDVGAEAIANFLDYSG